MSDSTIRTNLRMPDTLMADMDNLAEQKRKTRNEIIVEACQLYRDYVNMNKPGSLLPQYAVQAMEAIAGTLQTNLNARSNQLISSLAIQLFVIQKMLAENMEVSDMNVGEYTQQAIEMLKRNNRVFRMDDFI